MLLLSYLEYTHLAPIISRLATFNKMKDEAMAVPTSPTTKIHGKPTMLQHRASLLPPPPPPMTYPPNSPTHHVITRHPGGSYSSPRARHHGVLGMQPSSPYGYKSVPVSPVARRPLPAVPMFETTCRVGPPEPTQQRRAMEAAIMAERTRTIECEKEEATMTADELRAVLKKERRRTAKLAADLASFKCSAVQQQLESEVFEEGRINGLMRRVDNLQHEKEKIIVALEREEEMVRNQNVFFCCLKKRDSFTDKNRVKLCSLVNFYIFCCSLNLSLFYTWLWYHTIPQLTNNLQRKLNEVRQEKTQLETQIHQEKQANSQLRAQLSDLRNLQMETAQNLENQDEMEEE